MFSDQYIDKEENWKLFDVILRWLTTDEISLNPIDAEDPEVCVFVCVCLCVCVCACLFTMYIELQYGTFPWLGICTCIYSVLVACLKTLYSCNTYEKSYFNTCVFLCKVRPVSITEHVLCRRDFGNYASSRDKCTSKIHESKGAADTHS